MKKVITVIFILLFIGAAVFFVVDRVGADEDLTTIRVKISIGDPVTYDFKPVGSYYVAEDPSIEMDGANWYRVSLTGNNVALYIRDADGNYNLLLTAGSISFIGRESDNHDINLIYMYNDHYSSTYAYAGNMMFYKDTGAYHLHAINTINVDIYLFGVVGYEMSNSWPLEALKAQSVAARSYAVTHIGASTYYDVVDTTGSQVYRGYNHRLDRVLEAVWATRGEVVAYVEEPDRSNPDYKLKKSNVVCTFFAASNGGQIDIPQHVWNQSGNPNPWQKITDDPYDVVNPSSREETVFFPADAASESEFPANGLKQIKVLALPLLQAQGFAVSGIGDFVVLGVTDMYTADPQVTVSSSGSITEDHRKIFPNQPALCIDRITAYTTVSVVATKDSTQQETSVQVKMDLDECDDLSSPYNIFEQTSLRVTVAEPVMEGDQLTGFNLTQRRYGHGLGMSQRGAQTMAKEGFTYDEIIAFYYPNTQLWNLEGGATSEPTEDPGPTPTPSYNATVNCNTYLNVRLGPGTSYSVIGQLYPNDRVIVITPYATSSWHKIFYNETYAYAHKDYIILDSETTATPTPSPTPEPSSTTSPTPEPSETTSPTPEPSTSPSPEPSASPSDGALAYTAKGKVTCSSLNVRNGASTAYTIVGRVYRDDTVYIVEKNVEPNWHLIYYGNTMRYVYGGYISITSETDGYVYYDNGSYTETEPDTDPGDTEDPDDGDNTIYATVTASSLNIRSGPSTDYSIVGVIPRGGGIEVREYGTYWSKIRYGGVSGYVSSKYFVITDETNPTGDTATCIASSLRIRKGPGITYTAIGSIPYGATVEVLSYDASWSKVSYNGVIGYSSTTYLKMN